MENCVPETSRQNTGWASSGCVLKTFTILIQRHHDRWWTTTTASRVGLSSHPQGFLRFRDQRALVQQGLFQR
jgi:hypothetical protein